MLGLRSFLRHAVVSKSGRRDFDARIPGGDAKDPFTKSIWEVTAAQFAMHSSAPYIEAQPAASMAMAPRSREGHGSLLAGSVPMRKNWGACDTPPRPLVDLRLGDAYMHH